MSELRLRPFERRHLPLAESWFTEAGTQRWLGGPRWPGEMLDLADRPLARFRGAIETGRYRWLAWEHDTAVGYIDCGTHDRWTMWDGCGVTGTIAVASGSIAYVVDPALRRRGYGTAMIGARGEHAGARTRSAVHGRCRASQRGFGRLPGQGGLPAA